MSGKFWATIASVGGAGIGIPLYLINSRNASGNVDQNSQPNVSLVDRARSEDISTERRSVAKGKCAFDALPDDINSFLTPRHSDRSKHVTVSCSNVNLKNDYAKLPTKWIGWFPISMFADQSKATIGQNVEINTSTKQEDGNQGSYTEITFGGSGLRTEIKERLDDVEQNTLSRRVSLAKFSGIGWVYLFSDSESNDVGGDS